jgi:uncharacterized hydantoinase/oxoprolinase family protein
MDRTVCSITVSCLYEGIRTIKRRCNFAFEIPVDLLNKEAIEKTPKYITVAAVKKNSVQSMIYNISQESIMIVDS